MHDARFFPLPADYTYTFSSSTDASLNFSSRTESLQRSLTRCSETPKLASPSFVLAETYECWAPTSGFSKANLPLSYFCGNDYCWKLFNPHDEIRNAQDGAHGIVTGGVICGSLSFLLITWEAYWRAIAMRREEAQRPREFSGGGDIVVRGVPVASSTGQAQGGFVAEGSALPMERL